MSETKKYWPFTVRSMPGCDMTPAELEAQVDFISDFLEDYDDAETMEAG